MDNVTFTWAGWLLVSAIVTIIAACNDENNAIDVAAWGLGALFLPILLPLGALYLVVTALRDMATGK